VLVPVDAVKLCFLDACGWVGVFDVQNNHADGDDHYPLSQPGNLKGGRISYSAPNAAHKMILLMDGGATALPMFKLSEFSSQRETTHRRFR
jgi:hypothetical protein